MGLNLKLKGIVSPNPFKLYFKTGATAGNESVVTTDYIQYSAGSTLPNGTYQASSDGSYYNTTPIVFNDAQYSTQYWFKILDTVTGGYVIENIHTNHQEIYDNCINCCLFTGGTSTYIDCRFSGGSAISDQVATPTPTGTPTNTGTPTTTSTNGVTPTPTSTSTDGVTPTPTSTGTPTITETPTTTNTPTITGTPTITTSGSGGCITITDSISTEQINCLGQGPYNNIITRVTATLSAVAGVNVTVMINATRYYCYGGTTSETYYITITAGNLSNYVDITTTGYVDCGQESTCVPESISIDSFTSITPNYSICGVVNSTPTPTSTVTPTSSAVTYNCNNGVCEAVYNGSGLYMTLEECQSNCIQTTYYCKENELSPCSAQVGPCTGTQIVCTQFEVPN